MYFEQPILTPAQLKRLDKHKYSVECQSLLDPFFQKWWNLVVTWVPLWVAPNLITMVGLAVNIVTSVVLMWACPTATEPAPIWLSFSCALGLFIYQTLDAIDGKQARRTGTSSPLGELFDHGCDSLSTVFVTLASSCCTSLGFYPYMMLFQSFTASALFYCAHWQTYVTGTMRFGKFDVTEGQICVMGIMLVTAIFSSQVWNISLLGLMEFRLFPTLFASVAGSIALLSILEIISRGGAGKNGSTVAGTSVLTPILPLMLVLGPGVMIVMYSEEELYENNPILFLITFGLLASKITNKLIVAHMTRSELNYEDMTLLVPLVFFVNNYFNVGISEKLILVCSFIFISFDLILYSRAVCLEICSHLKVQLFRIKTESKSK